MKQITLFYIPTPDKNTSEEIACDLLEKKLIACANIIDANSVYQFKNKLNKNAESLLLIKTFNENVEPIMEYLEKVHPYEIPLIGHYNMNVNDKYFSWMKEQIL